MSDPTNQPQKNIVPTGPRIIPRCPHKKCRREPLINNECPKCGYKRLMGYETPPDVDMSKIDPNFAKNLTFKFLTVNEEKETVLVEEISFWVKDHPCHSCKTDKYRWLCAQRTGVYLSCLRCKSTTGPLSKLAGQKKKEYEVSPKAALKILESRHCPPHMLKPLRKMIFDKKYVEPRPSPKKKF